MNCPACNGEDPECFQCDGIGRVCDVCGEAVDDPGCDTCNACEQEGGGS